MKIIHSFFLLLSIVVSGQLIANTTINLNVKGMHCGSCESRFKSSAKNIKGIIEVSSVSAANNNAVVVYDEKVISADNLMKTLSDKTGYAVSASGEAVSEKTETSKTTCSDKAKCSQKKCDKKLK